jgi:hypothetical protein
MRKAFLPLVFFGACCMAQTMPYPVGYVYTTSVLDEDNLVILAATVSDTYGQSGHTTSAVVKITSPDSRVAYGVGPWSYSSFASAGLSFCDGAEICHDGLFVARSEGTQEYCPIAFTYMLIAESLVQTQIEPYAYVKSAQWVPGTVHYQNGSSKFKLTAAKTEGCPDGNANFEFSTLGVPSIVRYTVFGTSPKVVPFQSSFASAEWELRMDPANGSIGEISGTGRLMGAPCRILPNPPQNQKTATLKVEAP